MNQFTFGILTYNQENYILETLESIKYQKMMYGKNIDVFLIIADDASKDRTVNVIKQWLAKNEIHFAGVELIENKQNQGTVANFCTILEKNGKRFLKILAGDDLIGQCNLFQEYNDLDDKKLKSYFRVELHDGRIEYREKYLVDFYYHMKHSDGRDYNLKNFRRGRFLHTPSTIYTKQLYENADCEENLKGYRLFEDDPMWYSMLKNEKDLMIEFVPKGIVLYRVHDASVSNVPNPVFRNDIKRLREQYLNETKGLEKLYFFIRKYTHNMPMYFNPGLYIDKMINMRREWICKKDPGYGAFKEKIEQQIRHEQKYYELILARAAVENN